ncbi:MAG: glutaredoxin 3 [Alphaproteobacteria bacterium CG_4_10_14_0_2_um_filter_63_37]|nr:MAG: glutaredoxin 3 [Proteobacteria bacterium CG1_02_64_396]PJA25821.1 MAG: glutaredoxin 3 [Alphaproteobacteria bacterium CG_4_10_14_0_2_um_filter_63_37]
MSQPRIEIYVTTICPYCVRAKTLLQKKGLQYVEINAEDPAVRAAMVERAGGMRTVPQIFIGKTHVGGCDDLYALEKADKLDPLVAAEAAQAAG